LAAIDGEDATSLTLRLNLHAIRVMAARSSRLAPRLLLPRAPDNPMGVDFSRICVPTLYLWGKRDNSTSSARALIAFFTVSLAPLQ